jgi:hypothetical protein
MAPRTKPVTVDSGELINRSTNTPAPEKSENLKFFEGNFSAHVPRVSEAPYSLAKFKSNGFPANHSRNLLARFAKCKT